MYTTKPYNYKPNGDTIMKKLEPLRNLKLTAGRYLLMIFALTMLPMGTWAEDYDLTVAGVQVTSENAGNVLNDETATVTFDATTNTLTLHEAVIDMSNQQTYAVVSGIENLTVHLKGNNNITVNPGLPYAFSYTNAAASGTLTLTTENIAEDETSVSFGRLNVDGITDISNIAQGYTIASELFFDENTITEEDGWHYTVSSGYYKSVTLTYVEYYGIWQSGIHINSSNLNPESGGTSYYPGSHTLHLSGFGYNSEIKTTMPELIIEVVYDNTVKDFKYEGDGQGKLIFRKGGNNGSESKVSISDENGAIVGFANVVIESPLKVVTPAEVPAQWNQNCTKVLISDAEYYELTVDGVQVTSANAGNVTGSYNKKERPEVTYNVSTNTLTLDYAELTSESGNAIEFGIANLKVHLVGESSITCYNEDGVAFNSSVAGNTITFTTSATEPGSLFMTTLNEPIGNATASYENGLCYWANGNSKNVKQLYTPNIWATMEEDDNYELYISTDGNPDGTENYYSIDYADASLDDVPVTKADSETGVSLKGACTITAYAKYGDVQSENVTGKLFGFASRTFNTVVGQTIEMPEVIPALDNGMTVTFSADETSIGNKTVIENEGVFTTSGLGKVTFTANIQFGTTYPEDYTILNSDGMLGDLQVTVVPPAPTVSLEGGTYTGTQTVTVSSDFVDNHLQTASVKYYLGTDKTVTAQTYSQSVSITESTTLNVWVEGHDASGAPFNSDTVSVEYTILQPVDYHFTDSESGQSYYRNGSTVSNLNFGQENTLPWLMNVPEGLPVTYSSSDEAVATVDAEGHITLTGAGYVKITASNEATSVYAAHEEWVELEIRPSDPQLSLNKGIYYTGTTVTMTPTVGNGTMYYKIGYNGELTAYTDPITLPAGTNEIIPITRCGTEEKHMDSYGNAHQTYFVYDEPQFSVTDGSYNQTLEVAITTNIPAEDTFAAIYYKLNDSKTDSTLYEAGSKISITESTKVSAYIHVRESDDYVSDPVEAHYVIRQNAGLAFTDASDKPAEVAEYTIGVAEEQQLPTLHNENEVTVAYSSSNTDVATVNATTGVVTPVGVGETTITATSAQTDIYLESTTSYMLRVYKNLNHESVTVTIADADLVYDGTAKQPTVTLTDGTAEIGAVCYNKEYTNNTNAGTATVTITAAENLETENFYKGSVSKTFTIQQAALTEVTLNTSSLPYNGESQSVTVTSVKAGELKLTADEYSVDGNTATAVGDYTVTVSAKPDGNFTGSATADFSIVNRTLAVGTDVAFADGQTWASYYTTTEDLELPEKVMAYIVTAVSETAATVAPISYVPKNVPVLLENNSTVTTKNTDARGNLLAGTTEATAVAGLSGTVYGLHGNRFLKVTSGNIPARRAYLVTGTEVVAPTGAPYLNIIFGDATAIDRVKADAGDGDGQWYTLDGRKLQQKPAKSGLYIKNGRKVVINNK